MKLRDLTGQRFGQWLVLGRAESNVGKTGHSTYWNCLCDCGLIKQVATPSLQDLRSSCPCVKRREMIGKKFYQWTVIGGPFKPSYGNNLDWMCRCECGYEGTVTGTNLRRGGSKGCGCLNVKTIVQAATRHGLSKTLEYALFVAAKSRAKKNGIPFNLDLADIEIPDLCPVLGIPMFKATGKNKSNSPSLDKIIVELGYVKGNVWVISNRANTIKNNATIEEIELLATALRKKIGGDNGQTLYQLAG